jgi:hypothetical protein
VEQQRYDRFLHAAKILFQRVLALAQRLKHGDLPSA